MLRHSDQNLKTLLIFVFCLTPFSTLPKMVEAMADRCLTLDSSTFAALNQWPDGIIVASNEGLVLIKESRNFSGRLSRSSRRTLQRITKHLAIKDLGAFSLGENVFTYTMLSETVVTKNKIQKDELPVFERRQHSEFDEFIKSEVRGKVNEITELSYEVETAETHGILHSLHCIEYK